MRSGQHGPYASGYTRHTMAGTKRFANPRGGANRTKTGPSSNWRLQLASMKLELLVIPDQHAGVNTFPGLVHTARHTTKVCHTRNRCANRKEAAV